MPLISNCASPSSKQIWYWNLNREYGGMFFLDLSKAFDILNHDLLLMKISSLPLFTTFNIFVPVIFKK